MIDKDPDTYICYDCGAISAVLPLDGRCMRCKSPLRWNSYATLAHLGIDYFSSNRAGGWTTIELLRIARTMVFLLEMRFIEELKARPIELQEPALEERVEHAANL